jgi:hypothetical protein
MEGPTDEASIPSALVPAEENERNDQRFTGVFLRKVATRTFPTMLAAAAAVVANLRTRPPPQLQDEDIPAAKRPRLLASISSAEAADDAVAAHTSGTVISASPDDVVAVAPRDKVVVPAPHARASGRAPRRNWKPDEDTKLIDAVVKCGQNWVAVAALIPGRTNLQCNHRWINYVGPSTKGMDGKWTAEEDANLIEAVKKPGNSWITVAELVPGRTNFQCRNRWAYIGPIIKGTAVKGKWTAEEDAKLIEAVQKCGKDWVAIAALVPGRSNNQCNHRWIKYLSANIDQTTKRNIKWTAAEDAKLNEAVTELGYDWVRIATLVPGRTNAQCSKRWSKSLDPTISKGKWTPEEDAKLIEAVQKHGKDWVLAATLVPGRTNVQCQQRWASCVPKSKGKWSAEEDAKLVEAVQKHGRDWVRAATLVPGRTNAQCQQRWAGYVGATVEGAPTSKGKSSAEEDASQIDAIKECGDDRVTVAGLVPGRTNVQECRHICERLQADMGDKETWQQFDRSGRVPVGSRSKEFAVSCSYF